MHSKRVLSALVFIPLFVLLVLKGGVYPFAVFVSVAALLGLGEFYRLWANELAPAFKLLGFFLGLLFCIAFTWCSQLAVSVLVSGSILLILLRSLWQAHSSSQALSSDLLLSLGGTVLGIFYVVWLMGHLIWLRKLSMGIEAVFLVILITWASDTAAYYVGSAIGKHRLTVNVSPGKSIEGAIAGLVASVGCAYLCSWWFYPMAIQHVIGVGIFIGLSVQLGDLCESLLKRAAKIKDSGTIIPGHGGVLDRLDSLLFSAPCLYYYIKFMKL